MFQEIEAIKARVKEMEEEAEKLKEMQSDVEKIAAKGARKLINGRIFVVLLGWMCMIRVI